MTAPEKMDRIASSAGCIRSVIPGEGFDHVVYYRPGEANRGTLHVYLEGDGTPWTKSKKPAQDPTARNPLMLRLLALDPAPSLYLGRPCYNGLALSPKCRPYLWTCGRYSPAVVDSMEAALKNFLCRHPYNRLVFIGHSGGGTLAMLLAPRFPSTRVVVTLAGNLDIDAWCDLHAYTSLFGSLNPAQQPPLPESIKQFHFIGRQDRNIPPELIESVIESRGNAVLKVIDGCGHTDCWQAMWPEIENEIRLYSK